MSIKLHVTVGISLSTPSHRLYAALSCLASCSKKLRLSQWQN